MLNSGIAHFYRFKVGEDTNHILCVPDASVDVVFCLNDNNPSAHVYGSTKKPSLVEFKKGHDYFGVRYELGQVPDFLKTQPYDLIEQAVPFQDIYPEADSIIEKIFNSSEFNQQVNLYTNIFRAETSSPPEFVPL